MPYKDPEKKRAYQKKWVAAKRKRTRAGQPSKPRKEAPARARRDTETLPLRFPVAAEAVKSDAYKRADLDAERLIEWIEANLIVPEGRLAGEPFRLADFQRDFLRAACGAKVAEAALCIARKNGKTGLIAAWALYHICTSSRWQGIAVSLTGELANELRRQMQALFEVSGLAGRYKADFLRTPVPGSVRGANGTELKILAADKSAGHAFGADLVIFDELGLLAANKREMFNNVYRSTGARNGRLVAISVQGRADVFKDMLARAKKDTEGRFVCRIYKPKDDCDPSDRAAWKAGNPGLSAGIKSLEYMESAFIRSQSSKEDERDFLAFDLNLPGDLISGEPLVSAADWRRCVVSPDRLPDRSGLCYIGYDQGQGSSMTAAVAVWESGRVECFAAFPAVPDLRKRGKKDKVGDLYTRFKDRGELITLPGRAVSPLDFLEHLKRKLDGSEVALMQADRYHYTGVMDGLQAARLNWRICWRGQGYRDGGEDVRDTQRAILEGGLYTVKNTLLERALAESCLMFDPGGNAKLDKRRTLGRIDAAAAFVLGAAAWERAQRAPDSGFSFFVVGGA